jgi:hypothetical protein
MSIQFLHDGLVGRVLKQGHRRYRLPTFHCWKDAARAEAGIGLDRLLGRRDKERPSPWRPSASRGFEILLSVIFRLGDRTGLRVCYDFAEVVTLQRVDGKLELPVPSSNLAEIGLPSRSLIFRPSPRSPLRP